MTSNHAGAQIRTARRMRGRSLESVAERVGITRSSLSRIERGEQRVALDVLDRLANELDVQIVLGSR